MLAIMYRRWGHMGYCLDVWRHWNGGEPWNMNALECNACIWLVTPDPNQTSINMRPNKGTYE
jgi:hypothetical protein